MPETGKTKIVLPERIQRGDVIRVQVVMQHPMDTGFFRDANANIIPAWFITELTAKHNDKVVLAAEFGPSVSKNPYLAFKFKGGAKGDKLVVSWKDNKGDSRTDEAVIG